MADSETETEEIKGQLLQLAVTKLETDDTEVSTVLGLVTADSVSLSIDEDVEDENLANIRRTRKYRTHNSVAFEWEQLIAVNVEALEEINVVDEDGTVIFDGSRRLNEDEKLGDNEEYFLDIEYLKNEAGDIEQIHRLKDVEILSPDMDLGETPPITSIETIVHGDIELDVI